MTAIKEHIPGGLSSGKSPKDFDLEQLAAGISVELEHTNDRAVAQEIAMDHLSEDPNYYRKLKKVESKSYDQIIGSRITRDLNYSYKLMDDNFGMDIAFPTEMDIDESAMSVWIPFAAGGKRDGVGDLLQVEGIRTERHRLNPIVLFDHGKHIQLPIAISEHPITKAYTVEIDPTTQTARGNAFFYQGSSVIPGADKDHALFCEQLFDLIAKRYVRAGSIGYQIVKAFPIQASYETGTPAGLHLQSVLMLEYSAVIMPCNGETVRKALCLPRLCGKPLSPILVKSLQPYTEPKKVQLGYEPRVVECTVVYKDSIPNLHKDIKELRQRYMDIKTKKSDYFASCPRDETGHCKKQGQEDQVENEEKIQKPSKMSEEASMDQPPPNPTQDLIDTYKNSSTPSSNEPLGAQVLRRIHEDHSILLQEYDELINILEQEGVKSHLMTILQALAETLEATETIFQSTYAHLPGMNGEIQEQSMPTEQPMDGVEDENSEAVDEEVESGMETPDTEADSSEEELPTPEEAIEGMKKPNPNRNKKELPVYATKELRSKYLKKCHCKKVPCICNEKTKDISVEEKSTDSIKEGTKSDLPEKKKKNVEFSLQNYEKSSVIGARGFLNELSGSTDWGDEQRMKSYYWHKTLDGIGQLTEQATQTKAVDSPDSDTFHKDEDSAEIEAEESEIPQEMHPNLKIIKDTSNYFKGLSQERAFGNMHREKALEFHKALGFVEEEIQEENNLQESTGLDGEDDPEHAGDFGQKSIEELMNLFESQNDSVEKLHDKIWGLAKAKAKV